MKHIKLFLLLVACTLSAHAAPVLLVTPQEMAESNNAQAELAPKFVPDKDAPKIEVSLPDLAAPLASPTPIKLNFEATSPTTIKPETFKILYGTFQIDITQRLLSAAKVTAQGMNVAEASLPSGKHKLQLSIEDSMGRKGYRLVEFQIK